MLLSNPLTSLTLKLTLVELKAIGELTLKVGPPLICSNVIPLGSMMLTVRQSMLPPWQELLALRGTAEAV